MASNSILVTGYSLGTATAALAALTFWFATDSVILLVGLFLIAGLHVAIQEALEPTVTAEMGAS